MDEKTKRESLNQLKEDFLNRDKTLSIVKNGFEYSFEKRFGDIESKFPKAFTDLLQTTVWRTLENNIELVFEFSESPIEKIFFNALNMQNIFVAPFFLIFTPRFGDHLIFSVTGAIEWFRGRLEEIFELKQKFENRTGKKDTWDFIDWIFETSDIAKEDKETMSMNFLVYKEFNLYESYHLSLQATIRELKVESKCIRPDAFVWVPANKDFKLIIECDGFRYHSNKKAFTGDRVRDRTLQKEGYQVLRFSGAEVNQNPIEKAIELSDFLLRMRKDYNLGHMLGGPVNNEVETSEEEG